MTTFELLEHIYRIARAADLVDSRWLGCGVRRNEHFQARADGDTMHGLHFNEETAKLGKWSAFVSNYVTFHDDPDEAVRLLEMKIAKDAVSRLRDRQEHYEKNTAEARTALARVEALLSSQRHGEDE